jgi:ABC-type glycerol-3-phosphate transport system substrate-binding protein
MARRAGGTLAKVDLDRRTEIGRAGDMMNRSRTGTSRALRFGAVASIALSLGLAGEAGAWSLEEAAAPYKGATIRTIGESLPPLEAMEKLKHKFEERTGIKVVIEQYEHSEAVNKVMLDLNSRRGRYDFILQPHRELGRFVANGHLAPIEQFMNDPKLRDPDFKPEEVLYQGLWKEISWYEGKAYGFPFTALTMYLWYRADLLEDPEEQAGFKAKYGYDMQVPATWDQYRDLAEWFTRPDQGFYGTAIQGKRHEALWYEWLNFLYSFGGDMMDAKSGSECGPIIVNSPEAVASLDYYKGLVKYSPSDTLNYFWDDVMVAMQQGKAFEMIMWNDATYAVEDPSQSTVSGKMGFGQDGLRPRAPGQGRQGRSSRGLDLPDPGPCQEQGGGLPVHPVDDGIRPAARAAHERRRLVASRRLCPPLGPEDHLLQGVDGHQRGGDRQADDPRVARDHGDPGARAEQRAGRQQVIQAGARRCGARDEQAARGLRAVAIPGKVTRTDISTGGQYR